MDQHPRNPTDLPADSWEKFENEVVPALMRALGRHVGCSNDTIASVAHDALVEAFAGRLVVNPDAPFFGLYWIIKCKAIDRARRKGFVRSSGLPQDGDKDYSLAMLNAVARDPSPTDRLELQDLVNEVSARLVNGLDDIERLILGEHYIEGKSYPKIAKDHNLPLTVIDKRRKRLQEKFKKFRDSHSDLGPE